MALAGDVYSAALDNWIEYKLAACMDGWSIVNLYETPRVSGKK